MKSTHNVRKRMQIIGDKQKRGLKKRCKLSVRMVPKRETLIEGRDGNELMNSTRAYKLHDEVTKSQCGKLNQKIIN